jgi:hypothetical protein
MRNKRVGAKALVAELMKYLEKHSEELKRPFVPQIKLIKFFATLLGLMKKEEPMEEIGDEKITEIVDAYERGSSISKLMKKFAINYTAIFDILHENASPESIVKLALKPKRSFTKVDRENCILRAQQKLIDQGKEATPTAIETEIMNEYGPGVACYSTIARYFTQSTRAARANLTTLEKIKSDYERLTANGQRISYTKLARKHGVPVRQVERLLKKPPKQFNTLLERETHRGMIIDAFHALSPNEQLSKPTAIIARKLGVSSHIVRNDLMAAKLLIPKKRRPQSGNKYSNPLKRKNGDEPPRATKRSKH